MEEHGGKVRFGVVGTNFITDWVIAGARQDDRFELVAVYSRKQETADAFAAKHQIPYTFTSLEEMAKSPLIDAVYIASPNFLHAEQSILCMKHGKHVLCEKSITLNIAELDEAVSLAKENNVILAEAMTIYHMPVYKKLNEIIASGQLGRLNLIQVNFGSYKDYNMTNRFFSRKLAGGALLDIGVYSLSLIRWFFKETPTQVSSQVKYAPTGVDEQAGILLMNDAVEMATVTLSLHSKQPKRATLSFDKAYVEIFEYPRGMQATITYTEDGHKEVIDAGDTSDALYYEVCDMEKAINSASSDEIENLIHSQYTYDVMKIMSDIRTEWGMKYPEEE
mgnify:CR=1 FL=1